MELSSKQIKPCLVQTVQGFTVSYKDKLLYSKYNPQKAITQIIQNLTIQPQTLILCVSPVLPYGLKELSQKLPQDCLMLGCEYENELYDFMINNVQPQENFSFITREELVTLGPILIKRNVTLQSGFTLPPPGTFRRIIKIDFSAGAQFSGDIYDRVVENATSAIMTFWANRVTLVKFGRRYSSNFFKNLAFSTKTTPIKNYFGSIDKEIFVFGSGESLEQGIKKLNKNSYILCADTAAQALIARGIIPDGIFIEEAQSVISKCFLGIQNSKTHIFAGLSSLHSITRYFKPQDISFFTTEFTQASFIERFEKAGILPPKNDPFGSVGITCWYYACLFRKNKSVPVYTYGLDFSYSAGRTHTKGTMADQARFINISRIKNDANYGAAFLPPAFKCGQVYTTPILQRYAGLFEALRQAQGPQTMSQGLQTMSQEPQVQSELPEAKRGGSEPVEGQNKITLILQQEAAALQELKSILTGEKKIASDKIEQEITKLIQDKEYLYLHFPDGHKFQYNQSFLNRVRVEVDYFLKILKK